MNPNMSVHSYFAVHRFPLTYVYAVYSYYINYRIQPLHQAYACAQRATETKR